MAIGALLIPLNAYWLTWNVWYAIALTGYESLFGTAIFILAVLVGANSVVARWRPARALAAGELLVIYVMITIGTAMCGTGWDWMASLPTHVNYPFRYATPENRWAATVHPVLPYWLVVSDPVAVTGFWEGNVSLYGPQVWLAWWRPVLWWTSFAAALVWVFFCANSLLRKRWAEEERMAFPIAQVPMSMVQRGRGLWRSRSFQLSAGITAAIALLNFTSSLVPAVPGIPFTFDYHPYVAYLRPWSGIRQQTLWYSPFLIGLCYLIPLDLLLSLWVFGLMHKAQQVLTIHFGWNTDTWSGPPYTDAQAFGALVALIVMVFWLDRNYLSALLRGALTGRGPLGDDREALPHRLALLGLAAGLGYLWWFLYRMGMAPLVATAFLGIFLVISLTLARFRSQLGPPTHEIYQSGPSHVLTLALGPRMFDAHTLACFALLDPFTKHQRSNPSPLTLEAMKMGESESTLRGLAFPIAIAAVLGALSLFWANLQLLYPEGAALRAHTPAVRRAGMAYGSLHQDLIDPAAGNWQAVIAMGGGAAFCAALMVLKLHFARFPLHPVALPVSSGSGIEGYIGAIFLAWLVKAILLRWGGQRVYRLSMEAALGVIIGDSLTQCALAIVRQSLGMTT